MRRSSSTISPTGQLEVSGLVETPLSLTLGEFQALPAAHPDHPPRLRRGLERDRPVDRAAACDILELAKLKPEAKFIVFRCADVLDGTDYYESMDLVDAFHPQTIVAHALNGEPLPVKNGAPLRMRIERQLGYKHAKYLTGIEAVASLEGIGKGQRRLLGGSQQVPVVRGNLVRPRRGPKPAVLNELVQLSSIISSSTARSISASLFT